ncbi:hypothetical protein V6N13_077966 [Hibiscus sabdariffa]|uniref:Uncharacterized protein n=1 Tax=Hibiscus sabdariffa TaxID=183260 RepID=A0ABR2RMP5_9ROSI
MGSLQLFHSISVSVSVSKATDFRRRRLNRGRVGACLNVDVEAPNPLKSKSNRSREVMEEEGRVLVGTYARAPVVLSSGKGCKLYDPDGREFLDCAAGIAVNALGHGDPDWIRAITEQANVLTHVSNAYYSIPQYDIIQRKANKQSCPQETVNMLAQDKQKHETETT